MPATQKYDWTEVDNKTNANDYVAYLHKASSLKAIQHYKTSTFALLKLEKGMLVLDVGCGTGADAINLASLVGPGGAVVGIDKSDTMISQARKLHQARELSGERGASACHDDASSHAKDFQSPTLTNNLNFIEADAEHLPFDSNTFDACRADRVLQHLGNPTQAICELIRVTKPGGHIVVSEPDWETLSINSKYAETSRALKNLIISSIKNPSIGVNLPALFYNAGITSTPIHTFCLPLSDFDLASEILLLKHATELAQNSRLIDTEKLKLWIDEQQNYSLLGNALFTITGFAAVGIKG
jgi:ubiquinone/menaquinone biosynthesis C-methylase UbiE